MSDKKFLFISILKKLFKNQTKKIHIQFFRYIFVGFTSFIVDIGILYFLTEYLGLFYLISAAIAFIIALITNYILCIKWIFTKRKIKSKKFEFGIFITIGILGLFFNEIFIWLFTSQFGINYLISKILTAIVILLYNFLSRRIILYPLIIY